jgi:hypothetical protein
MESDLDTATGILSDPRTVVLDRPLSLPLGRVRVAIEALPAPAPEHAWLEKLHEIRRTLRQSGYHFRGREDIDVQIQTDRDDWDHN